MTMMSNTTQLLRIVFIGLLLSFGPVQATFATEAFGGVSYKTVTIDGLDIFYRSRLDISSLSERRFYRR